MEAAAVADAAAAAAADADPTLEFDAAGLKALYDRISPYIVRPFEYRQAPGVIVRSTETYDLVAVHSDFIKDRPEDVPEAVQYSNNTEAVVDAVAKLSPDVTVMFVPRIGDPLPDIEFSNLNPQDGVCEKVVTFFNYMDTVAMFKGHIVLKNATSRDVGAPEEEIQSLSIDTFTFTAPYAFKSLRKVVDDDDDRDLLETRDMTLGAPVFNLDGRIIGILNNVGFDYSVKFARNAEYLCGVLSQLWGDQTNWVKGEEIVRPKSEDSNSWMCQEDAS